MNMRIKKTVFLLWCALMTPLAAIAQQSLPVVMDFEDVAAFNQWTMVDCTPNSGRNSGTVAHGGTYAFGFMSGAPQYLVSPELEPVSGATTLTLWYKSSWTSTGLAIGFSSTTGNISSFIWNNTVSVPYNTPWTELSITVPVGTKYVAIQCAVSGTLYIDDISIASTAACARVSHLTVSAITDSSAILHWRDTANNGASYAVYDMEDNSLLASDIFDTSVTIEGLNVASSYTLGVQAHCSAGDLSQVATVSFHTDCGVIWNANLPWSENFDGLGDTVGYIPCWNIHNARPMFPRASANYNHGTTIGRAYYWTGSTDYNTICVLPTFESPVNELMVNMWFFRSAAAAGIEVGYVTDPDDVSTYVGVTSFTGLAYPASQWNEAELFLSNVPLMASNIAFKFLGSSSVVCVDDIVVRRIPNCPRPTALVVRDIGPSSAELFVQDSNTAPNYTVQVFSATDTVLDSTFTSYGIPIDGLTANTEYTVKVIVHCNDGNSYNPMITHFRSSCTLIAHNSLPWHEGFDSYPSYSGAPLNQNFTLNIDCWNVPMRFSAYFPCLLNVFHYDGGNSLYAYGSMEEPTMVALPAFEDNLADLQLTFMVRKDGVSDFLEVGVMSNPSDPNTYVPVQYCTPTTFGPWQQFDVTFAGFTTGNITFRSTGNIYLDSIVVKEIPPCMRPTELTMTNLSNEGATATIHDVNNTGSYRLILYNGAAQVDSLVVCGNSHTFTTLSANTVYRLEVRTLCDGGTVTEATTVTFRTLCDAIADVDLPWSEGFESMPTGDVAMPCWSYIDNGSIKPRVYYGNAHGGDKSLRFSGYAMRPYYVILPGFESDINDLMLSFWAQAENNVTPGADPGMLRVGYLVDVDDSNTFVPVDTLMPADYYTMGYREVHFANAPADARIAIAQRNSGNYYWWIDDLTVGVASTCRRPESLWLYGVTDNTAQLHIEDSAVVNSYLVEVIHGSDTMSYYVNDTTLTLANLTHGTVYIVNVRTHCYDGTITNATTTVFQTEMIPVDTLPYFTGFESGDDVAWQVVNGVNAWMIGSGATTIDSMSLYISNNGRDNAYSNDVSNVSFAARSFHLTSGEYMVSFDWRAVGESVYDFLRVWLVPEDAALAANVLAVPIDSLATANPVGWTDVVGGRLNLANSWNSVTDSLSVSQSGIYKLVFCWINDANLGLNPPAAIDNVRLRVRGSEPVVRHQVTLLANDTTMGSVSPAGTTSVMAGSRFTATATPAPGHRFLAWTSGGANVSTTSSFVFTVTADTTLTALFEPLNMHDDSCYAPTNVAASDVTATSALISWTETGTATQWIVDYNDVQVTVDTNPYTLTGLTAGTQYYVQVKAVCSEGSSSEWGMPVIFNTEHMGIAGVAPIDANIFPNPANGIVTVEGLDDASIVQLINMNGREVACFKTLGSRLEMNVSSLGSGVYFVRVTSGQRSAIHKLIVE